MPDTIWKRFLKEDEGQSLVEYSLLLCFTAIAAAGLMSGVGRSVSGAWNAANSQLTAAVSTLSPGATQAPQGGRGDHGSGEGGHQGGSEGGED